MDESSKHVLQFIQGRLSLTHANVPELGCLLLEVNEKTCRGSVMFQYLEAHLASAWKPILVPNRLVHVKIEAPPNMNHFEADALLLDVLQQPAHLELTLEFHKPTPAQRLRLKHATTGAGILGNTEPPVSADAPQAQPAFPAQAPAMPLHRDKKLGPVLVQMGYLSADQLDQHAREASACNERLGRYLARCGILSTDVICRALALQSGLPVTNLDDADITDEAVSVFPLETILRNSFVPFDASKRVVCIAAFNPLGSQLIFELERDCGRKVELFLALEDQVLKYLDKIRMKFKHESRKFLRYEIKVPVSYQYCGRMGTPAEPLLHSGMTLNASEDGFLIEGTPASIGSPDELRRRGMCVNLTIAGTEREIRALCQLRTIKERSRMPSGAKLWLIGLKIAEISSDDRRRLKELCIDAIRRMKGKF